MQQLQTFENLTISSNAALTVEIDKAEPEKEVYEYTFLFSLPDAECLPDDARAILLWTLPCVDVQYMWHPNCRTRRVLDGNWRLNLSSALTASAPVAILFNSADQNRYTFALDEVKKVTGVNLGIRDSDNTVTAEISLPLNQFAGQSSYSLRVRADFRPIPYYQALEDTRLWWEERLQLHPMPVPETAGIPMYSSWYNFHQAISDRVLEEECALAAGLGMKAIIVDDGWQTSDTHCGYGYTGDWEACREKIADMRAHVARVHQTGLKYILWYSVPYVGYFSKNWERFQNKLLCKVERSSCGVLDPRYPEVRDFLIQTYANAVRGFDLDGLKLDFLDRFFWNGGAKKAPGMDYACVQDATERLLEDISAALQKIKPDILIEFRQQYIGPAMRQYGNIFRVGDCASDLVSNRVGTIDLRLLSGNTACHCDMLTWSCDETVEDAALQILHSIFGVLQISQMLSQLPAAHRRMLAFWIHFSVQYKKILHGAQLIPYEPHFLYPVVKACDGSTAIIGVYAGKKIVAIDAALRKIILINATKEARLFLDFETDCKAKAVIYDTCGERVSAKEAAFAKGLQSISVPRSGLVELQF